MRKLLLAAVMMSWGCSNSGASSVVLERVRFGDGTNPKSAQFVLLVEGRGFGVDQLAYSLDQSSGSTRPDSARLELFSGASFEHIVEREQLALLSPRQLEAQVVLSATLAPGIYGVRLKAEGGRSAVLETAFEVANDTEVIRLDSGVPDKDGGGLDAGESADLSDINGADSGPSQDQGLRDLGIADSGVTDQGSPDLGPPDLGAPDLGPADSGLGPFPMGFGFRQPFTLQNNSTDIAPPGVTVLLPIAHADKVAANQARADGLDFAVFDQAQNQLPFAFEDPRKLNTNQLILVVELQAPVPVGPGAAITLAVYHGNPNAQNNPNDSVFTYVERFENDVDNDGPNWTERDWEACNYDHSVDGPFGSTDAYCIEDQRERFGNNGNRERGSLISEPLSALSTTLANNLIYEANVHFAGRMDDGPSDVLLISENSDVDDEDASLFFQASDFVSRADLALPTHVVAFADINAGNTVAGFSLPAGAVSTPFWSQTKFRFRPRVTSPSIQMRYVSDNDQVNGQGHNSFVVTDDWWVRLSLAPEFVVTPAPFVETR